VSRTDTLRSLEIVLESFLERAVRLKENRLRVLGGINRLDDIARHCRRPDRLDGADLTDQMGAWFAAYRPWLQDQSLRPGDRHRLRQILDGIQQDFQPRQDETPATRKIAGELNRWRSDLAAPPATETPKPATGPKLVLKKGPESLEEAGVHPSSQDSIGLFAGSLQSMAAIFHDLAHNRQHLMSILDHSLKSAALQKNREALLLSATIIYYLRQNGYLVSPFVKRLKEAERIQKEGLDDA
jgi:hypothetical protein